jgi:hypothetical protein
LASGEKLKVSGIARERLWHSGSLVARRSSLVARRSSLVARRAVQVLLASGILIREDHKDAEIAKRSA